MISLRLHPWAGAYNPPHAPAQAQTISDSTTSKGVKKVGFFQDNSKEAYDRTLLAAEVNPRGLSSTQKEQLKKLANEPGERGNRARKALGQS